MSAVTKSITARVALAAPPDRVFEALITPSAICAWWGAARAVVMPEVGGVWCAAWGAEEDRPDYIAVATLTVFEPPRSLELGDYRYAASQGPLPFEADFRTAFNLAPEGSGTALEVEQRGFPDGADATDASESFYRACIRGWDETLAGIKRYLEAG